ncbi:MAG: hypothetical protein IPF42_19895 [Candidatus Microthrix sp.]|nr:hypothetical protein [Candidatus Microthrix sp.]
MLGIGIANALIAPFNGALLPTWSTVGPSGAVAVNFGGDERPGCSARRWPPRLPAGHRLIFLINAGTHVFVIAVGRRR